MTRMRADFRGFSFWNISLLKKQQPTFVHLAQTLVVVYNSIKKSYLATTCTHIPLVFALIELSYIAAQDTAGK